MPSASLSGPSDHEDVTGVSSTVRRADEVTPCGAVSRGRRGHKRTATQTMVDSPVSPWLPVAGHNVQFGRTHYYVPHQSPPLISLHLQDDGTAHGRRRAFVLDMFEICFLSAVIC